MEIVEIIDDPATEIIEVHVAGPQGPQGDTADVGPAIEAHAAREDVHGIPDVKGAAEAAQERADDAYGLAESASTVAGDALPAAEVGETVPPLLDGIIPAEFIDTLFSTESYTTSSEEAMLALDAEPGDFCYRSDITSLFVLLSGPASEVGNWAAVDKPVTMSDVIGLSAALAGKANSSHTHGQADITGEIDQSKIAGLVDALAGKQEKDGPWVPLALAADCVDLSTLVPDLAPPLRYRRNGDVLRFSGMIAVTENAAPGKLLATLDEDDWPQYPVAVGITAAGTDGGAYVATVLTVATNGEISTLEPVTAVPMSHITIELT